MKIYKDVQHDAEKRNEAIKQDEALKYARAVKHVKAAPVDLDALSQANVAVQPVKKIEVLFK